MLLLLTLAVTGAIAAAAPHVPRPVTGGLSDDDVTRLTESPDRRVRALSPVLKSHLAEGLRRSATFASLVLALEESDLIVQLVEASHLPPNTHAQTVLVADAGDHRFVRVQVGVQRRGDALIVLLGHELMHAVEIAGAPGVRDERTLEGLYRKIGISGARPRQYDTLAALDVERRVRRDLGAP